MLLGKEVYLIQYFQINFIIDQKTIINTTTRNDSPTLPRAIH